MRPSLTVFFCTLAASGATRLSAQQVPTNFVLDTVIATGLGAPNDFCFTPDGRILLADRGGAVKIYAGGPVATIGTVPNVETGSERALLSVAADPNFATNGHIYVWYSGAVDAFMHLDRFTCTGDLAVPTSTNVTFAAASRRVILANVPDNAFNHNGGTTRFGPDGMLYQSIGDDASSCQAQGLTTQQGALLRLDVSTLPAGGSLTPPAFSQIGPSDNPLGSATDFSRLLIAHGLRNPVRLTIDPATGNLYIGDVGQNAHEEYTEYVYNAGNLQLVNFGWPWREGNAGFSTCGGSQPAGLVAPLVDIPQSGTGWLSVMGGPRYRNRGGQFDFGQAYEGVAFYTDYFAGQIRALVNNGGTWAPLPAVPGQPNATNWGTGFVGIVSFDVGADGSIYVLQHPSTYATTGGTLKRIRPLGPVNEVLVVSGGRQFGPAGEPFSAPLVLQVNDPQSNPLAGATITLGATGGIALPGGNTVVTDGNGRAQVNVSSTVAGGQGRIVATTNGGNPAGAEATFFGRKVSVIRTSTLVVVTVSNQSTQSPVQVPMILMASALGVPVLPTPIGPICTNPFDPFTFVLEDSLGLFGFASLSGTGGVGTPALTKVYNLPAGLLSGVILQFQAVGVDPTLGVFRTNCEVKLL